MLSQKCLHLLKKLCMVGYYVGAFPFMWTPDGLFVQTPCRLKYYHWVLVSVYCTFNAIFMTVRLGQAWCCMPGFSTGRLFINFFSVTTFTTIAFLHANTAMFHDELPIFLNQLLKINDFLKNTYTMHPTEAQPVNPLQKLKSFGSKMVGLSRLRRTSLGSTVVGSISIGNVATAVRLMKRKISMTHPRIDVDLDVELLEAELARQHLDHGHLHAPTIATERLLIHKLRNRHQLRHGGDGKGPRKRDVIEIRTWIHGAGPEDATVAFMHRIIVPLYMYSVGQFFIAFRTVGTNPKYVYTLFNMKRAPKFAHALCAVFEFYVSLTGATTLLVYITIVILYVRSTRDSLAKLSRFNNTGHYHRVPKHYRALQLINMLFNSICRTVPLPAGFATSLLVLVVSNYATLKLVDEVKMPVALGFPLVSLAMISIAHEAFPNSYRIYGNSLQLLRLLQHKAVSRRHYVWKFVASCRPLRVLVGPYFVIKRETILTYMGIAFNTTFQVLLVY